MEFIFQICFFNPLLCFLKNGQANAEGTTCFQELFVSSFLVVRPFLDAF